GPNTRSRVPRSRAAVGWRRGIGSRTGTSPCSAQEGLAAGPVADDEDGVLLGRVTGRVEQSRTTLGRALPDPPAIFDIERCRLVGERRGEVLVGSHKRRDPAGAIRLRFARVRVVLADVRGHGPLPA